MIIGEFHFGALDRGLFHPGLIKLENQEERGRVYVQYVTSALKHANVVGVHWHQFGGHDHLYPDYNPCPDMGGAEALKAALTEVRRRGKRSIIYANGQLQERGATAFWRTVGKDIAIMGKDGKTYQKIYHKYSDIPIFLRRIAGHMRQINPDFIVMTEGLHDCALDAVSMFHACQTGAFHTSAKKCLIALKPCGSRMLFPKCSVTPFRR